MINKLPIEKSKGPWKKGKKIPEDILQDMDPKERRKLSEINQEDKIDPKAMQELKHAVLDNRYDNELDNFIESIVFNNGMFKVKWTNGVEKKYNYIDDEEGSKIPDQVIDDLNDAMEA